MKTLGGVVWVHGAVEMDYCLAESVASMKAICDEVVVIDVGSQDQTAELCKSFQDKKTKVVCLPYSEWEMMKGKELIAHFQNMAKEMLSTDWYMVCQADEVIHEYSFPFIKAAIEKDNEGYFCSRINLWMDSQHELNVTPDRLPVGNRIIRLAKTKYYSVGDGEGIWCGNPSWEYLNQIRIYHMGFVRNKFIHTKKIEHVLMRVFGHNDMDKKVVEMNGVFNPFSYFGKDDLIPISEPLPKFVQEWAKSRDAINDFKI